MKTGLNRDCGVLLGGFRVGMFPPYEKQVCIGIVVPS